MDVFIGTIQAFGFNFAPVGWANCNGQLVNLAQNQALFALLGTVYGGNGTTVFGLPDLRGRAGLNMGQVPGLSGYTIGQMAGGESASLTLNNLPMHNHTAQMAVGVQVAGTGTDQTIAPSPTNNVLGASNSPGPGQADIWSTTMTDPVTISGVSSSAQIEPAGGSTPVSLLNPYLVLNFCIAMQGIFPTRD